MELSEKQKLVIEQIKDRKVVDLYSYIMEILKPETFRYDEGEIETKKKEDYEKSKDKIDDYLDRVKKIEMKFDFNRGNTFSHSEYTYDEHEEMRKKISDFGVNYSDFQKVITIKENEFKINTLKEDVYIVDDLYTNLLEFLSLWNILEENQFILSVPKKITKNDAKIFFEKNTYAKDTLNVNKKLKQEDNLLSQISKEKINFNLPISFDEKHFYKQNDKEYSNIELSVVKDALIVAENYIDKRILVLPNLTTFVQDKFITNEEKKYRSEKKRANIAIGLSGIIALVSLGLSYYLALDNTTFWEKNEGKRLEQYNEMNSNLININKQLLETNRELNEIKGIIDDESKDANEEIKKINTSINKINDDLDSIIER